MSAAERSRAHEQIKCHTTNVEQANKLAEKAYELADERAATQRVDSIVTLPKVRAESEDIKIEIERYLRL